MSDTWLLLHTASVDAFCRAALDDGNRYFLECAALDLAHLSNSLDADKALRAFEWFAAHLNEFNRRHGGS